jgi:hypothetical protein
MFCYFISLVRFNNPYPVSGSQVDFDPLCSHYCSVDYSSSRVIHFFDTIKDETNQTIACIVPKTANVSCEHGLIFQETVRDTLHNYGLDLHNLPSPREVWFGEEQPLRILPDALPSPPPTSLASDSGRSHRLHCFI